MGPNIWIVVVTYNGCEDTLKCLRSLAAMREPRFSTVLVDNASADDTVALVEAAHPWCHVVRNAANHGFTGGNNRGIEYALARGAEWVILLNNDTIVSPDFSARMADAATAHAGYGVIGPVVNYMDEPAVRMLDGFIFNAPGHLGFFQPGGVALEDATPARITEVDVVDGCCMMIAAPVFARIGLLDDRYFIYHEVVDFCLKAMGAGFRCGTIGDLLVWHKGTGTFKHTGKRLPRYYDARNLALVLRSHGGARHRGRSALGSALLYIRYVYWRYSAEREAGHNSSADAVLEGFWDALVGRYGAFVPHRRPAVAAFRVLFELHRRRPRPVAYAR